MIPRMTRELRVVVRKTDESAILVAAIRLATVEWAEAEETAIDLGFVLWGNAEPVWIPDRDRRCYAEKQSACEEWIEIA